MEFLEELLKKFLQKLWRISMEQNFAVILSHEAIQKNVMLTWFCSSCSKDLYFISPTTAVQKYCNQAISDMKSVEVLLWFRDYQHFPANAALRLESIPNRNAEVFNMSSVHIDLRELRETPTVDWNSQRPWKALSKKDPTPVFLRHWQTSFIQFYIPVHSTVRRDVKHVAIAFSKIPPCVISFLFLAGWLTMDHGFDRGLRHTTTLLKPLTRPLL